MCFYVHKLLNHNLMHLYMNTLLSGSQKQQALVPLVYVLLLYVLINQPFTLGIWGEAAANDTNNFRASSKSFLPYCMEQPPAGQGCTLMKKDQPPTGLKQQWWCHRWKNGPLARWKDRTELTFAPTSHAFSFHPSSGQAPHPAGNTIHLQPFPVNHLHPSTSSPPAGTAAGQALPTWHHLCCRGEMWAGSWSTRLLLPLTHLGKPFNFFMPLLNHL